MCFVILDPLAKHGDKYSALELSINKIYKLPCPRELIDLSKESASTTSVKTSSSTPTKPIGRAAKVIKINLDIDWRLTLPMFPAISSIDH